MINQKGLEAARLEVIGIWQASDNTVGAYLDTEEVAKKAITAYLPHHESEWQEKAQNYANNAMEIAERYSEETNQFRVRLCKALGWTIDRVYPDDIKILEAVEQALSNYNKGE